MKLSKSKLALAKVINENGGWHSSDVWFFSTQSGDGVLRFWVSKPKALNGRVCTEWSGGCRINFALSRVIKNWHQTILSREEYYQAYPKADADGWVEWKGGMKSPVESGVPVDVKTKDGYVHYDQLLGDACWRDNWGDANIISYRLHKPEVKQEFCESVMRSIPEQEAKPTIEQLTLDYRNKLDYANRKQQEADDAKADADAALGELERAGDALGLLIGIAKPEPELVITDWRDLKVGDVVEITGSSNGYWKDHSGIEMTVKDVYPDHGDNDDQVDLSGESGGWSLGGNTTWRFIRRP